MASAVTPFLMFEGRCEEAVNFYVSLLPGSEITQMVRYGPDGPKPGTVNQAHFRLGGRDFRAFDSPVAHGFTFTPAMSIFIDCEDEAELDGLFARLADGGQVLMEVGSYGFSRRFGWVNDRFGVSWQLNLP